MNQKIRFIILQLLWLNIFSKLSIEIPHFFISNSSFIHLSFSLPIRRIILYKQWGKRWINGQWDISELLHICWCPPKGICHAGNPQKITPPTLNNFWANVTKVILYSGLMCSITSCTNIISYFSCVLCMRKFSQIKLPFKFFSLKKEIACDIRISELSIPVTKHSPLMDYYFYTFANEERAYSRVRLMVFLHCLHWWIDISTLLQMGNGHVTVYALLFFHRLH